MMLASYSEWHEDARKVFLAYRKLTTKGSADWIKATRGLASQHQKTGEHRDAIELFEQLLDHEKGDVRVYRHVSLVESYLAIDDKTSIRFHTDEARLIVDPMAESKDQSKQQQAIQLRERLDTMLSDHRSAK